MNACKMVFYYSVYSHMSNCIAFIVCRVSTPYGRQTYRKTDLCLVKEYAESLQACWITDLGRKK